MKEFQKKLTKSFFVILSLPATAMGFALSVQISALSWILTTKYHLNIEEVGLVWAAGPIAGILGQVIFGVISDKVWFWKGRRRPFIFIGGALASVSLLALPNIDVISETLGFEGILGVAIAVALALDLSINVGFNPTRSIIADVTPEGVKRTQGYTWMQTISGTFGVLAYVIGALWNNYVLIYTGVILVFALTIIPPLFIEEPRNLNEADESVDNNSGGSSFFEILNSIRPLWGFLIYSVYAIVMKSIGISLDNYYVEILCFLISIYFILEVILKKTEGLTESEKGIAGFKKVLAAHSFTWIGIQTMFIYMFAFVQHEVYGVSELKGIEQNVMVEMGRIVSIAFLLLNAVGAALPAFVLEPIARKFGRVKTHAYSIASMAAGYLLMFLFGYSSFAIYAIMIILGIGWASTISLPFAIMSQKVSKDKMGLYMGLFNLSVVLPQLVASFGIGKTINESADKSLIFIIAAITLAISALLWFLVKEDKKDYEQ